MCTEAESLLFNKSIPNPKAFLEESQLFFHPRKETKLLFHGQICIDHLYSYNNKK